MSLGSNSASNSALVGSCSVVALAAAALPAAAPVAAAAVEEVLAESAEEEVVVFVSVFFMVVRTLCPLNAAWILTAAFAKRKIYKKLKTKQNIFIK